MSIIMDEKNWHPDFKKAVMDLHLEFPQANVVAKEDSKLMAWISRVLFWLPGFMSSFGTTIRYNIYLPRSWIGRARFAGVVRHEHVHVRQYHQYGSLYELSYLFCLPSVWTMRAVWEMEAYTETLRHFYKTNGRIDDSDLAWVASQFTGYNYLYMRPFPRSVMRDLRVIRGKIQIEERELSVP